MTEKTFKARNKETRAKFEARCNEEHERHLKNIEMKANKYLERAQFSLALLSSFVMFLFLSSKIETNWFLFGVVVVTGIGMWYFLIWLFGGAVTRFVYSKPMVTLIPADKVSPSTAPQLSEIAGTN